jgi:hypothetical protein
MLLNDILLESVKNLAIISLITGDIMKILTFFATLALLSGCCSTYSPNPATPVPLPQPPVSVPSTSPNLIQEQVDAYNATRTAQGQESIQPGLSCQLWTVGTGTSSYGALQNPISVGSFLYTGVFNVVNQSVTNGLSVLPVNLQSTYQTWYALRCTGYLVVVDNNYHSFSITSDDGSIIKLNGSIINDDGLHAATTVSGSVFLGSGVRSFELDYLAGPPTNEALIVTEDGNQLDPNALYH